MMSEMRLSCYYVLGVILTLIGALCLYKGLNKTNLTPIFNIPVFVWGLIGYSTLAIWTFNQEKTPPKLSKLFFVTFFTFGTSAAIGISIGGNFFSPFCFTAWVLNLVIVIDLTISLVSEISLSINKMRITWQTRKYQI